MCKLLTFLIALGAAILSLVPADAGYFLFVGKPPAIAVSVITTTGSVTWTVPANFISLVSVECISGGGGSDQNGSSGGGAYAKITSTSTTLTPGVTSISIGIGAGGAVTPTAGGHNGGMRLRSLMRFRTGRANQWPAKAVNQTREPRPERAALRRLVSERPRSPEVQAASSRPPLAAAVVRLGLLARVAAAAAEGAQAPAAAAVLTAAAGLVIRLLRGAMAATEQSGPPRF